MASKKKGSSKPKKVEEKKPEGKPVRHKPKSSSSSIKGVFPRPDQFDKLKGGKTQAERAIRQERNFEEGQSKLKGRKRGIVKVDHPTTKQIERHGPTTIETRVTHYTEHGLGDEGHLKSEKPKDRKNKGKLKPRQAKGEKRSHELAYGKEKPILTKRGKIKTVWESAREPRNWHDQAQMEVDIHDRVKKGKRGYPMHFLEPKLQALHREIIHPNVRRHVSHALQIELERRAAKISKEKGHKVNPLHRAKLPIYVRYDHNSETGGYDKSRTKFGPVWRAKEADIHHEINSYFNLHKPMASRKEMTHAQQRKLNDAINYVKENTGHAHTKKLTGKAKLHAETAFGGAPTGTEAEKAHNEVKKYESALLRVHDNPIDVKAHVEKKNIEKRTPAVKKLSHKVHDIGEKHWHKEMNRHRDDLIDYYRKNQHVIHGLKPHDKEHPSKIKVIMGKGSPKLEKDEVVQKRFGKRGKQKVVLERHTLVGGKIVYTPLTRALGEKNEPVKEKHTEITVSRKRMYEMPAHRNPHVAATKTERKNVKDTWRRKFKAYENARTNWEHHFRAKHGMIRCRRGLPKRRTRK